MNFVAINWLTRLFYVISFFVVYLIHVPILYFYILFFFMSVEILLLKKSKSETKFFKLSQLFFIFFVSYVLFVRSFIWGFSDEANYNLNTIEHILFAIVICLSIYFYFTFFGGKKLSSPIFLSAIIFNIIGLFNEFFQNYFQGKPVFILEDFSIKDIIVNVLGTLVFMLLFALFKIKFAKPINQ